MKGIYKYQSEDTIPIDVKTMDEYKNSKLRLGAKVMVNKFGICTVVEFNKVYRPSDFAPILAVIVRDRNGDEFKLAGDLEKYKIVADLDLPSGTLWMKQNIGATSETDYGLYFQWGDIVGYTDANYFTWSTCPGNGGNSSYNSTSISAWDNEHLTNGVLNTDVDAAYAHTEGLAKVPTRAQYQELFDETEHTWVGNS